MIEQSIATQYISLTIPEENKVMSAYMARPKTPGTYPGILLFMEIFGINSHIKEVAARLAHEGYVVLVPDIFHRTAPGLESSYDQMGYEKGMPLLHQLNREQVFRDIGNAYAYLKTHSSGKIGAIGFCIGGHLAYLAATRFSFDAVASFYGGAIANTSIKLSQPEATVDLTPSMAKHVGRILCFFGEHDSMISAEERNKVKKALESAQIQHEVITYQDASHGFFCDQRGSFHQPSRDDAWQKVRTLFSENLQEQP